MREGKKENIGNVPGFHTPVGHVSQKGDAVDASPAATPTGPVPDPVGNIPSYRHSGNKNLPTK